MTTMCLQDLPAAEVLLLQSHPRIVIRDAVTERCKFRRLNYSQTQSCIDVAQALRMNGASVAVAIEEGKKTAERIAREIAMPLEVA